MRQRVAADQQRRRQQHADAHHRKQHHVELQVVQARLDREEQDREQVLHHQDAERDAARQRVELELVVEHLDDDDGAAQRDGGGEIERVEAAVAERNADQEKQPERQARSSRRSAPRT